MEQERYQEVQGAMVWIQKSMWDQPGHREVAEVVCTISRWCIPFSDGVSQGDGTVEGCIHIGV